MTWLHEQHAWAVLFVVCGIVGLIAAGGQLLVHRWFARTDFVQHNEVAGYVLGVLGTIYAVMLSFVTVVVWQEYDASTTRLSIERAEVASVWHLAVGLPEPLRAHVQSGMGRYARLMIDEEWPLMRVGQNSSRAEDVLTDLIGELSRAKTLSPGEAVVQSQSLQHLIAVHSARNERLTDNVSGVNWLEWTVMFLGAATVIGMGYLFGLRNVRVHLMMTATLAIVIASMWVLIFELDYPYRGDLAISPQTWDSFLRRIEAP